LASVSRRHGAVAGGEDMTRTDSATGGKITLRRLEPAEWRLAFPVIAVLRTHLTLEEFLERVDRQSFGGYQIVGAFVDGRLAGVLGVRPVHTLARGAHLQVDDLVVADEDRRADIGKALMDYVEREAQVRGMGAVFLDARSEAVPFYKSLGFGLHHAPAMRKLL
jgi:GNAT superfamily N-acetyltransferase